MQSSDLILYLSSKVGTIPGRTVLQKLCYFANVKLGSEIPFKPHYYGPYSTQVAQATDTLLTFDLLDEARESGSLSSPWVTPGGTVITDWERRSYSITNEGKRYLSKLPKLQRTTLSGIDRLVAHLQEVTKLDARALSTLAKVDFMIRESGLNPTDVDGILRAAKAEEWKLTRTQVVRALKTLSSLRL